MMRAEHAPFDSKRLAGWGFSTYRIHTCIVLYEYGRMYCKSISTLARQMGLAKGQVVGSKPAGTL
jgi:hypothetical protein